MWKDYFYFTKSERRGVITLAALIVATFAAVALWPAFSTATGDSKADESRFEEERANFLASLKEMDARHDSTRQGRYPKTTKREVRLAAFDPNTADSITFLSLGLPPWMAGNILRYRAKGGMFRKAEDFKKIYGLTEERYRELSPYIQIAEAYSTPRRDTIRLTTERPAVGQDSLFKYPEGTVVDLNKADTAELKKIPGIGTGIANRIVSYRERLGGFYSVEQLRDIHLKAELLHPWFSVDEADIRRIPINKVGVERLTRHPYINFYQARLMVEYRQKRGTLKSLRALSLYEEFTAEDLERIGHYVDCGEDGKEK
ncbi:MAG: helix-hairpin-helix domain-containing protein [Mediterranea sp.]|jgi:competence ComEA-like helix-hairpin-helix protein|nr:helix-hairpin-helix domain-containing protein [Mediterranea sp.]